MASFITFNPPLGQSIGRIEIRDFYLGSSDGKGADGRAYPAHMRRLWVRDVREAIVLMIESQTSDRDRSEFERSSSQYKQIRAAIDNGTTFGTVIVYQQNRSRRVKMHLVKITQYTLYFGEPNRVMLSFQRMSEGSW